MNIPEINLDDPNEVEEFISKYRLTRGRALANALGMAGKGSAKLATNLSCYAWNKSVAMDLRRKGDIPTALGYEAICDRIYAQIPIDHRPW